MARGLGFRQIHLLSFSSQRWGRLFESIAKSSALQDGWGRSNCVIIYVDLYFSGWHWRILWDRDRGLNHSTLPYSWVNNKCRWEHIVTMKTDFGLKVVTEKSLLHMHKVNMWSAQALTPWKPACSSFSLPKIASLIRPSKTSLQTLTDNLTLDQKWVSFEQFEVNLL